MLILVGMVTVFPADGIFQSVIRILLSAAIFWLSLSVMVLLVMWGQKQEQSTAEGAYHSDMNALMNMVRSQRHDYNLHVQTVASLIAQQKWDECRGYVNALVQDTSQMNDVLPVKDSAVAGLIHNYRLLAEQSGHTLSLDIWNDMSEVVTSADVTVWLEGDTVHFVASIPMRLAMAQ